MKCCVLGDERFHSLLRPRIAASSVQASFPASATLARGCPRTHGLESSAAALGTDPGTQRESQRQSLFDRHHLETGEDG